MDTNHFIRDLDNRMADVCKYLQNAKAVDDTFKPNPNLWNENYPIHYRNYSKKVKHDIMKYYAEFISCN